MQLRPYQEESIAAVYDHLRDRDDNPCVVLPTGSGKTPVIGTICRDAVTHWDGRVLVLAHVKELLQQAAEKLQVIAPEVPFGIYSAGLNSRDTKEPVIIAGIQSVYERACELGRFDLILIDEVHLVPESGEGRYRSFLKAARIVNPHIRMVGFTATPYRMDGGMICKPENMLNHICYEKGVKELIREGYLCPIHTKVPASQIDCSHLHTRHGEFVASEVSALFDDDEAVRYISNDIVRNTKGRKGILVFAANVGQALGLQKELRRLTQEDVGLITGETSSGERSELLSRFQGKPIGLFQEPHPLRWLVNVNVLTTGFDAPNVDCVAIARPTASASLYYQMVGRGFRIFENKTDCLILDYGSNIQRHGPIDAISVKGKIGSGGVAPVRECPECHSMLSITVSRCGHCGYVFPLPDVNESKLDASASRDGILSGQKKTTEYEVHGVTYSANPSKKNPHIKTLKVEYQVGLSSFVSKWVCPEHQGWVRTNLFLPWWKLRTHLPPATSADEAAYYGNNEFFAVPRRITVIETAGEFFPEVTEHDFTEKPSLPPSGMEYVPAASQKTCFDCDFYFQGQCQNGSREEELWGDEPACVDFIPRHTGEGSTLDFDDDDDVPF